MNESVSKIRELCEFKAFIKNKLAMFKAFNPETRTLSTIVLLESQIYPVKIRGIFRTF